MHWGRGLSPTTKALRVPDRKRPNSRCTGSDLEPAPGWNKKVTLLVTYYRMLKNVGAGGDFRDPFARVLAQSLEHSRCPQRLIASVNE